MNRSQIFHTPGGRILSDPENEIFVEAFAVAGDRVVATGPISDLIKRFPGSTVVSLEGALILPGLCDAHLHLMFSAARANGLNLNIGASINETIDAIRSFSRSLPPGARVLGFGFGVKAAMEAASWPDGPNDLARILEGASGGRPVFLISNDAHTVVTSSRLGDRGPGVLRETVFADYDAFWPPQERSDDLDLAPTLKRLHSEGITWVHNFEGQAEHDSLVKRAGQGLLDLRVFSYFTCPGETSSESGSSLPDGPVIWAGAPLVTPVGLKTFADGSLGSLTAAMDEPLIRENESAEALMLNSSGVLLLDSAGVARLAKEARRLGVPLAIHAIGDRAFREVMLGFGQPLHGDRIEHGQTIPEDLAEIVSSLPAGRALPFISIQPLHMLLDFKTARDLKGSVFNRCYAFGTLRKLGFKLMSSSDSPVVSPDTAATFRLAVDRITPLGAWSPKERISAWDMVRAMTVWPAEAVRASGELGVIAPGSRADFAVLREDLLSLARADSADEGSAIVNGHPLVTQTWFGGQKVHGR